MVNSCDNIRVNTAPSRQEGILKIDYINKLLAKAWLTVQH